MKLAMLYGHNAARAAVGVPPLVWSESLAASARAYADMLALTGRFEHAPQRPGGGQQGENLFRGSVGAYSYAQMVGLWAAEGRMINAAVPAFRGGSVAGAGHYTQIVWRGTTAVGCAIASGRGDDFLVCRYFPAGNVIGQRIF